MWRFERYIHVSRGASLKGDRLSKCNRVTRASYSRAFSFLSDRARPYFLRYVGERGSSPIHPNHEKSFLRLACSRRNAHARVCPLERASVAADVRPSRIADPSEMRNPKVNFVKTQDAYLCHFAHVRLIIKHEGISSDDYKIRGISKYIVKNILHVLMMCDVSFAPSRH